jgi:hypothetical protein
MSFSRMIRRKTTQHNVDSTSDRSAERRIVVECGLPAADMLADTISPTGSASGGGAGTG